MAHFIVAFYLLSHA